MNNKKFYIGLFLAGLAIQIIEDIIFGWGNPGHGVAGFMDVVSGIFLIWGLLGDLLSNLTLTKNETHNITTKHLTIEDRRGTDAKTVFNSIVTNSKKA